ncbi:MAG: dockerin type I domain-containing protein [Usitatibacteraceae bacterium]
MSILTKIFQRQFALASTSTILLLATNASAQTPGAPVIGTAFAGDSQVFIAFSPPSPSGTGPITSYTATCSPVAGSGNTTGNSVTSPIAVSGLTNGTAYGCFVNANNGAASSVPSATVNVTPVAAAPLALIGVASRKTHGPGGVFDVKIDNTIPITGPVSVEPRSGIAGHNIVFQFNATVASVGSVTAVDETAAAVATTVTPSANEAVVALTNVPNNRSVTVTLPTVNGTAINAQASIGFLVGDINSNRAVNSSDISGVKARSGQTTNLANFLFDVNASGAVNSSDISSIKAGSGGVLGVAGGTGGGPVAGTIMFVAQVPTMSDFASRASTFGNHRAAMDSVARGGDLMIRYPDGALRNLTKEAGFGMDGMQLANAIAVREPTVHWSGTKAVFSMVIGAPTAQYQVKTFYWQLYEVSGLAKGQTATITKVPNQPATYNNISPLYGTDDRILFTSDRPRNGAAHLYPQLDEYESTATVTGIWSLNPATADLRLLNHTPSGAFSPSIDSFGRVIFTRWDHMQQDQQADADRDAASKGLPLPSGSFNYTDESAGAAALANNRNEVFPETRADSVSPAFGAVNGYTSNFFTPWQMNEDGSEEETLNHVGRHELAFGYIPPSFATDSKLSYFTNDTLHANNKTVRMDGGLFHLREDPLTPGTYFGIQAREFGSLTSDQIVKLTGGPSLNAEAMVLSDVTPPAAPTGPSSPGGRYRNPLPLSTGALIASHTPATSPTVAEITEFRLKPLTPTGGPGTFAAGASLTGGITKAVSWWDPDTLRTFNGFLWEMEAAEVVARPRPTRPAPALEAPESAVLSEEGVNEAALRTWMKNNDLALIVTRNQTTRDRADLQQPFNLQVPGGAKTVATGAAGTGKLYDISHFQIFQGDQVRAYNRSGRRVIAQNLHDAAGKNVPNPGGPPGSVKIALDGSTAAFVPARRALAWQTTDAAGNPVVRERVWITVQPGEVRVCASCHGANTQDQAGHAAPTNKPEALRDLLRVWKLLPP